jgi:predicted DCC family thiol-disulfide oxidoreductase YuxK
VTFYYDSDCGVCTALAGWAERNTRATLRAIQASEAELLRLGVPPDRLPASAYANADGRLLSGSRAIAALLADSERPWVRAAGRIAQLPLVRDLAEIGYRVLARHRGRLSGLLKL